LQELYEIVEDVEDLTVKQYFAMEFIESFYLPSLPMILLISEYKGKLQVPGINSSLSVKKLIEFFEEFVDLNAN
jgi:hypothetical protein